MAGALVVSALVAEVAHLKMAAGADPVALRSQNLPGSEVANEELIARYRMRSRLPLIPVGSISTENTTRLTHTNHIAIP